MTEAHADVDAVTSSVYSPLSGDQIRILVLLAGEPQDELWGYFDTVCLQDEPDYKALSYTWGTSVFSHTLHLIDGDVAITRSLYGALHRLRDDQIPVKIWADAVCINQRDTQEKSSQVEMMARVYGQAQEVLVWLGEASSFDCQNRGMIRLLHDWYLKFHDWRLSESSRVTTEAIEKAWRRHRRKTITACPNCRSDACTPDHFLDDAITNLLQVWQAPWFHRLWVVQEAALATKLTFVFGDHTADFRETQQAAEMHLYLINQCSMWSSERYRDHFASLSEERHYITAHSDTRALSRALSTLKHISGLRNSTLSPDRSLEGRRRESGQADLDSADPQMQHVQFSRLPELALEQQLGGKLLHNLLRCADLSASVPHDHLYAVRSISGIEDAQSLKPDYSLPLATLWIRVALYILHQPSSSAASLLLLHYLRMSTNETRIPDLPSWVPDFGHLSQHSREVVTSLARSAPTNYSTGGSEPPNLTVQGADDGILCSPAIAHGKIREVRQHLAYRVNWDRFIPALQSTNVIDYWRHVSEQDGFARWYFPLESRHSNLVLVSRSDVVKEKGEFRNAKKASFHTCLQALKNSSGTDIETMKSHEFWYSNELSGVRQPLYPDDAHFMSSIDSNKCMLASLEDGTIAWVPKAAQAGDVLHILKGFPRPLLLRSSGQQHAAYALVGEAYVIGIMHGQLWPLSQGGTPSDRNKTEADIVTVKIA